MGPVTAGAAPATGLRQHAATLVSHGFTAAAVAPISIEAITELPRFRDLRDEWTHLLAHSDADSLFVTWEWLYTWWRHLGAGRRLQLVAVRRRSELIGLAPFAVTPGRRASLAPLSSLAFLGTGSVGSDYLDVIVARGREAEVLDALAAWFDDQALAVAMAQLPRGSSSAAWLAGRLARRGWRCVERPADVCPFIPLEGESWSAYLGGLTGHHRSNVRRRMANLHRAFDVRFEMAETDADRARALAVFLDVHGQRWRERGGSTAFYSPELRAFHEEWTRVALEQGWLR